ncbi:M23 family metallopeptidase [Virgibacillus halodenitrificans]|jgi:stage II sporulation protein Q|uniref:Peptidoglycan DD-metalloendopeptidase family protein n=1 Tax=Virgibacillus halodenitrificans TaxID=1482 RepID=A0ABR7VHP1_VIRHA|nr:M23 family metallopeptidase [Virgibacillus halodenitrificans]MBD1221458.1 peptidoglycan DD-metalloendopeptidase family protein [Virgibacillus halodenitrificans]MCG1028194.1 peptidoglycan DD-metalloendopeptidase family protein [Virgibacillus halodenitrificans]MEC2158938.1 peptidoglycan DD-metalloendopeptidase family protein [Virgibacillus halodenitrificans]MYL45432.1 peptidoglycan DD-metalloendopeptidase family protein [Virgibacillus halodenitrificans]CDQ31527.1 Stage II sporulation protein 
MNEENKGTPKNKWSNIFRKKWFFPALYLTIAAVLLSVVVWYQNLDNQIPDAQDQIDNQEEGFSPNPNDEDAQPVMDQQEVIEMPVTNQDQAEIVTKFFDYNAEQKDQESALVLYNNRYYQSKGVDIASANDETFEVVAALSGTITEVKEDPLLGNVVVLSHDNDVMTYYASLGDVKVKAGEKIKQGDLLGTAGKNLFGKDSGTHVYFELRKDGKEVNPETYFNQPVSKLENITEEVAEEDKAEDQSEQTEATETEDSSTEPTQEEDTQENDETNTDTDKQEEQGKEETNDTSASA